MTHDFSIKSFEFKLRNKIEKLKNIILKSIKTTLCLSGYDILRSSDAGWSSLAARRAHNPKVVGSSPASATQKKGV